MDAICARGHWSLSMKNKTDKTEDAPIKKVQLNTRVPEPLKIAVAELSERTEISSETIVADALARLS